MISSLKMWLGLLVVVLGLVLGASYYYLLDHWRDSRAEIAALKAAKQEALQRAERAEAASARLAQKNAATARKRASAGASLQVAQDSTPAARAWADQPVPKEVQDALAKP